MLLDDRAIAIVGGGPGGLTLARLFQLKNVEVKVFERDNSPETPVQGTTLDLHEESGLAALRMAGLMDAFKENYRPGAEKFRIVDNQGTVFYDEHSYEGGEMFGGRFSRPEIDRGPLRKMLLASLRPGTVIWSSQFDKMEKKGEGWELYFKNGFSAYADIVIGADGSNSRVRPYITPIKSFYSGVWGLEGVIYNSKTTIPGLHEWLKGGKIFALGNGQVLIASLKGDGSLSFFASLRTDENRMKGGGIDFSNKAQVVRWFQTAFPGWSMIWLELFEKATAPFIPRPINCVPLDQTWDTFINLTMLGDAAHQMPPFAGEGVNMAMLDALELSECLTSSGFNDILASLSFYEDQMLKRAAESSRKSLENTEWMHSEGALNKMLQMFGGRIE